MKQFLAAAIALFFASLSSAEELGYSDLVGRMTDMEALSILPQPGEKCGQFSSYDRRSRYDAETNTYIDWDANLRPDRTGDGDGYIRKEEGGYVLAEMDGPGCVWRIWSAAAMEGHLKFYLDGEETPAIDQPFSDFFSRDVEPFTYPGMVYRTDAKGATYVFVVNPETDAPIQGTLCVQGRFSAVADMGVLGGFPLIGVKPHAAATTFPFRLAPGQYTFFKLTSQGARP